MNSDSLSLPENWDSTGINENIGSELLNIIRLLIAKTKMGEIEWEIFDQTEDRFILSCNKEEERECYECEIFGNRICIEIIKKYTRDCSYDVILLRLTYDVDESFIHVYDSSKHYIGQNNVCFIRTLDRTIKAKINTIDNSSLKLFIRAQELRKLLESGRREK